MEVILHKLAKDHCSWTLGHWTMLIVFLFFVLIVPYGSQSRQIWRLPLKLQKYYSWVGYDPKILLASANQFAGFFTFDLFDLLISIPEVYCYIALVCLMYLFDFTVFDLTFWNPVVKTTVTNLRSANSISFLVYLIWIPQSSFLRNQRIYWTLLTWLPTKVMPQHLLQNAKSTYFI